ncbi:MAG: class I SAM-dependent methyltransferase [Cytophagaceae bacterium]
MIQIIHPQTKAHLTNTQDGLISKDNQLLFPLKNGAYRLVSDDNYTSNFGLEWNTFQKTQIDKYSGLTVSEERFFAQTNWAKNGLSGENILEVGSGAGRFSQIVLDHTQANLYSVDYSSAVEANYKNNGPNSRLHLFQASIYELPFAPHQFDKVFCFGVLQHTPDVKKSVECLIQMLKPGGELIVDFYPIRGWYSKINAKYLLRPFSKNMSHETLMSLIRNNVNWLAKLSKFNTHIGLDIFNRFIPLCDINKTLPSGMSDEQLKEWIILDTFDVYSPNYDQPQKIKTVVNWFKEFGLLDVKGDFINYYNNLEAAVVKGKRSI